MKRIFIYLLAPMFFMACEQGQQEEVARLSIEKQALQQQIEHKDSTLNAFFSSLNQIEENLQQIKEKEGRISKGAGSSLEGRPDLMNTLNEDIRQMGELMEKNRQLIARLNRDFSNSSLKITELDKMISRLNQQLQEKEVEISILQEELGNMNLRVEFLTATVDTLEEVRQRQEMILQEKELALNTAWFAMGSQDELLANGIIIREGGFLGLGRTNKLSADLDPDYFTRVDITRTPQVTIPGQEPVLISTHPEGSWSLRMEDEGYYLDILDPEKFWSTSRHLVIMVE